MVYGFGASFFDNVLLDYDGLPHVLPLAVPISHSTSIFLFEFLAVPLTTIFCPISCFQTSEELTGAEILSSTQEQPYHSIQRGEACSLTPQLASQQLRCLGRLTAYRLIADSVLTVQ